MKLALILIVTIVIFFVLIVLVFIRGSKTSKTVSNIYEDEYRKNRSTTNNVK